MEKSDFTKLSRPASINIEEWKAKHPRFFAIVEQDPEREGYGWIIYRGGRPYPYTIKSMLETSDNPEAEFGVDLRNCYEIVPREINFDGYSLSPSHAEMILRNLNKRS